VSALASALVLVHEPGLVRAWALVLAPALVPVLASASALEPGLERVQQRPCPARANADAQKSCPGSSDYSP
jgi:hypothetical protein